MEELPGLANSGNIPKAPEDQLPTPKAQERALWSSENAMKRSNEENRPKISRTLSVKSELSQGTEVISPDSVDSSTESPSLESSSIVEESASPQHKKSAERIHVESLNISDESAIVNEAVTPQEKQEDVTPVATEQLPEPPKYEQPSQEAPKEEIKVAEPPLEVPKPEEPAPKELPVEVPKPVEEPPKETPTQAPEQQQETPKVSPKMVFM